MVSQKSNLQGIHHASGKMSLLNCSGRWVLIVLCALAGVILAIALVLVFMQREQRVAEATFQFYAQRQSDRIRRAVDGVVDSLLVLHAFFDGSDLVESDEFDVFTERLIHATPDVLCFGWAQSRNGEGGRESFPILLSASRGEPIVEPGWDLASTQECRDAIAKAQNSMTPVLSAPFSLGDNHRTVVLVAAHLKHDDLEGIVFAIFMPATVVNTWMVPQYEELLTIRLFDAQEQASLLLMAQHAGDTADSPAEVGREKQVFAKTFHVADRTWLIETEPTAAAHAQFRGWQPWGVGFAALLLTASGVGILVLLAVRTSQVEQLVAIRTAEVKESEERLRTITNAALDAVVMVQPDGTVAHWNPAAERMFGFRQSEMLGKNVHAMLTPEPYREQAMQALNRFTETGEGKAVGKVLELEAVRSDGTLLPIEISVAPIAVDHRWGAVAIVRDITERHAAQEAILKEQKLLRQMLEFQERERKLIAYEIHDGLVQQLTGAHMTFQSLPQAPGGDDPTARDRFEAASGLLCDAIAEARRLISGLRPPVLDESGLEPAVTLLVDQQNRRGGPQIDFVSDLGDRRLPPLIEVAAFRIIQEGLSNACRHSRADHVGIELHANGGGLRVRVQDSGKGFDPSQVGAGHFGLQGIRERARLLGGAADVHSVPGQGTTVQVTLPVSGPAAAM